MESSAAEWQSRRYGAEWGEWLSGAIRPALLVEPFIGELCELPVDYKLWTFGGKVRMVQAATDRYSELKCTMFDTNWDRLPVKIAAYPSDPRPIPKPLSLNQMIEAAEILAEDLPFVRIDFYEVGNVPKFGEMTFYPGAGIDGFDPLEWDFKLGKLWSKGTYAATARRKLGFRALSGS
ncbi:MAG: ATP-grasp fold amidoligase family protein [Steroidobacteraceae bacterium]